MQHAFAKLSRGPDAFVAILQAMGVPAPHVMAWLTILTELLGGVAVLLGAFVTIASVPMMAVLLTALFEVHLPDGPGSSGGPFPARFRYRLWASSSAPTRLPSRQEISAGSPYVHELPWSLTIRAHQFSLNGRTSTSKVHAERGWRARWCTVIAMSSGSR
jgi:DoxX